MSSWARWKAFESDVAKFFGGMRRVRISYAEKSGDIIHSHYTIECKYGLQVPKCLIVDVPTVMGDFLLCPSEMWGVTPCSVSKKDTPWFLIDALAQARKYDSTKEPLVCVKRPGQHGFIIIESIEHVFDALKDNTVC